MAAQANDAVGQAEPSDIRACSPAVLSSRQPTEIHPTATSNTGAKETAVPDWAPKTIDKNQILEKTVKVPLIRLVAMEVLAAPESLSSGVLSRPSFRNSPTASAAFSLRGLLAGRQDGKAHRREQLEAAISPPKNSSFERRRSSWRGQYAPLPARFSQRVLQIERSGKFHLAESDREPKKKAGMYPARRWFSVLVISQRSFIPERHFNRRRPSM
jgi:hypothetical protein